jgi:DNA invertase Pin-like site-specific DNA recombinase
MATILSRFSSRAINTDVEAAPATTSKQAIIYCRVSSQVQSNYGDGCVSLQAQEAACREYCRENKIAVVEVHHEVRSGRNMERMHILNRIVRKLKPGQQIVFYNITRFSRNVVQGLNLITKIQNKGCSVYSVQEKCAYADAASQHLFRSTLCFAQHESDQISQRVRTSVAFRKARGDHFGPAPFGKKVDRLKSGKRVLLDNVAEKRVIEKIKKLYYDKMTPIDIAHYLNGEGVLNRGKDWTSAQISALIQKHCHLRTNDLQRAVKSLELESGVDELLTQASVRSVGKRGAASMQVNEPDAEVDLESDNESESSDLSEDSDSSEDSEEEAPPKKVTAVDRPKRYRR